jgi:23S rRNA pseudouridine1911/1915/1917 synthase
MPKQKSPALQVLYEDNHLLVVVKPAGLATQGVAEGTSSVLTEAKEYLKKKYGKPGNVYLGVVSRLDSTVSGVLVLARTSKAADRLTKQFQSGGVEKVYWALVEHPPAPDAGELSHWVLKNDRQRRMEVVQPRSRGAQHARLTYRTLGKEKLGTLVEVRLHTGRKHQIRLQLSAIHSPIVGDRKYGSHKAFAADAIALHCVRLAIEHPTTKKRLEFTAQPPPTWGFSDGRAGRENAKRPKSEK